VDAMFFREDGADPELELGEVVADFEVNLRH
jgi:hypothetical protein